MSVMLCTGLIKHTCGLLKIQSFRLQFRIIHQNITSQVIVTSPTQKMRAIFKQLLHQDRVEKHLASISTDHCA